jgi:hypothetical protein
MTKQGNLLLTHVHSHSPSVYFNILRLYAKRVTPRRNLLLTYSVTHSTEQSRSWQARNSPNYMEPEGSLLRLKVPATWVYPKSDKSSHTLFITAEIFARHNKSTSLSSSTPQNRVLSFFRIKTFGIYLSFLKDLPRPHFNKTPSYPLFRTDISLCSHNIASVFPQL